nr:MFS transporter [Cryobacterium roopkundense]
MIEGRSYGWWLARRPFSIGDVTWPFEISVIPVTFLITVLSGIAFVWWGVRRQRAGKTTLLAFSLFRISSFRNGNIAALIVSLGEFGIILSLPPWLQNVLGYDALQTGFVLLALAMGAFVASGVAGALGNRVSPVTIVRAGLLLEIVGVTGLGVVISAQASWLSVVPFLFVYGLGVGLATAQLTGVVLKDVPVDKSGQGSGTSSTARQIGSALGIAVLGTILFTSAGASLDTRLVDLLDVPPAVRAQIVDAVVDSAGSAIPALEQRSPTVADAARQAFSDGTRYSAFAAAGFLALGFLATLRLSGRVPEEQQTDAAGRAAAAASASPVSEA